MNDLGPQKSTFVSYPQIPFNTTHFTYFGTPHHGGYHILKPQTLLSIQSVAQTDRIGKALDKTLCGEREREREGGEGEGEGEEKKLLRKLDVAHSLARPRDVLTRRNVPPPLSIHPTVPPHTYTHTHTRDNT